MSFERKKLGRSGEDLAAEFLRKRGMEIISRNYVLPIGEIDILARDGDTIVIVEVKTKKDEIYGKAVDLVHHKKQNKLRKLAALISREYHGCQIRIDVVAINYKNDKPIVEYIRNAVEE